MGDDGEDYAPATCEACGNANVRYVHTMRHDDWKTDIQVGCVCAGKLAEDYEGARERERGLVNLARRRQNWLTRCWRISRNGNQFLNLGRYNVGVAPDKFRRGWWRYWIKSPSGRYIENSGRYDSIVKAKLALFDQLAAAGILGW